MSHFENLLHFISRLQSATGVIIKYDRQFNSYSVITKRQHFLTKCKNFLLKFSAGIAKRDDYYNVRQNSTEVIRKYNSPLNSRKHKNASQ